MIKLDLLIMVGYLYRLNKIFHNEYKEGVFRGVKWILVLKKLYFRQD